MTSPRSAVQMPPGSGGNVVHVLRETARLDGRIEEESLARERALAALEERLSFLISAHGQIAGVSGKQLDAEEIRLRLRAVEDHLTNTDKIAKSAAASAETSAATMGRDEADRKQMKQMAAALSAVREDVESTRQALASQEGRLNSSISDVKELQEATARARDRAREQENNKEIARADVEAEARRSALEALQHTLKDDVAQAIKGIQKREGEGHRSALENLESRLKADIARSSSELRAMLQQIEDEVQAEVKDKCQKLAARHDEHHASLSTLIHELNEQVNSAADLANAATDLAHQACQGPDHDERHDSLRKELYDHFSQEVLERSVQVRKEVGKEMHEEIRQAVASLSAASSTDSERRCDELRNAQATTTAELQRKFRAEAQLEYQALREATENVAQLLGKQKTALHRFESDFGGDVLQRLNKLDETQKAAVDALEVSLQGQVTKLSTEQSRRETALRSLFEEHADEMRQSFGKRNEEHRQSAGEIAASVREEMGARSNRLDSLRASTLESTVERLQEDVAKVTKAHSSLKDLFGEHRAEIEGAYARRGADFKAELVLLNTQLAEQIGGCVDRTKTDLRLYVEATEAELRKDAARLDREVHTRLRELVEQHQSDNDSNQTRAKEMLRAAVDNIDVRIEDLNGQLMRVEPAQRAALQMIAAELRGELAASMAKANTGESYKVAIENLDSRLQAEIDSRQNRIENKLRSLAEQLRGETSDQIAIAIGDQNTRHERSDGHRQSLHGALDALDTRLTEAIFKATIVCRDIVLRDEHGRVKAFASVHDLLQEMAARLTHIQAQVARREGRISLVEASMNPPDAHPALLEGLATGPPGPAISVATMSPLTPEATPEKSQSSSWLCREDAGLASPARSPTRGAVPLSRSPSARLAHAKSVPSAAFAVSARAFVDHLTSAGSIPPLPPGKSPMQSPRPVRSPMQSPRISPRITSTSPVCLAPTVARERAAGSVRFGTPPAGTRRSAYVQASPCKSPSLSPVRV